MNDVNPRQYYDFSGKPCPLNLLVRNEPEWAANQILHRDKLDEENRLIKSAINDIKEKLKAQLLSFEKFTLPHNQMGDTKDGYNGYGQAIAYSHTIQLIESYEIFKK